MDADEFAAFTKDCIESAPPDFWDRAASMMKARHWNVNTFTSKTLLNISEWYRLQRIIEKRLDERDILPGLQKAMAICIGLDIAPDISASLLASAGYILTSSTREHIAYRYVLWRYHGRIDECNDFLESHNIEILGSKSRDS